VTVRYIGKLYECDNATCVKYIFAGSQRIAVKQVSNGLVDYYHQDHLGSSSVITNGTTGAVEENLAYYAYGATRIDSHTPADVPFKYTGKELDNSTGLYFYGARYYDATLGRFISADTIVPDPRNPQELNRYTYALNNPLIHTDPTGHFSFNISKFLRRSLGPIGSQIVIGVVAVAAAYFTAGAASGAFLEAFNVAVGPPTLALATTANVVGGIAGGVVGGGLAGGLQGGNLNSAFTGALTGGVTGGVFSGLGVLTAGWDPVTTAAAYGVAGGTVAEVRGGSFLTGFEAGTLQALVKMGFSSMRTLTDELARKNDPNIPVNPITGEYETAGTTGVEDAAGNPIRADQSLWTRLGITMDPQGQIRNSILGMFFTGVSKVHDVFNSINYNLDTGRYISRGSLFDTGFGVYNFAGMLPAAVYAAGAIDNGLFVNQAVKQSRHK